MTEHYSKSESLLKERLERNLVEIADLVEQNDTIKQRMTAAAEKCSKLLTNQ
jgi:hypothetical protein